MRHVSLKRQDRRTVRSYFQNRYFRKTYFLFMLVTVLLVSGFFGFYQASYSSSLKKRREQKLQSEAELMRESLDEKFHLTELLASQIGNSSWAPYLASEQEILNSRVDYFRKRDICNEIANNTALLGIVSSIAVLVPQRDLAADGKSIWESERYFHSIGLDTGTGERIRETMEGKYGELVMMPVTVRDSIQLCLLRRIGSVDSSRLLLFALIDDKQLSRFVQMNLPSVDILQLFPEGSEDAYTELRQAGSVDVDDIQIRIHSEIYSWDYGFWINKNVTFERSPAFFVWVIGYIGLLSISLLLSLVAAALTYRPIAALGKRLGMHREDEKDGMTDELLRFEQHYRQLQEDKEAIETMANQYFQIGQNNFCRNLLSGAGDRTQLEADAKSYANDFKDSFIYRVVLFVTGNADEKGQRQFTNAMTNLNLDCYYHGICSAVAIVEDGYALIIGCEDQERLDSQDAQIDVMMDEYLIDREAEIYHGGNHHGFRGIHRSYQEALNRSMQAGGGMEADGEAYFPFDARLRFLNLLRIGSYEEVLELIGLLKEENMRRDVQVKKVLQIQEELERDLERYARELDLDTAPFLERWGGMSEEELSDAQTAGRRWEILLNHVRALKPEKTLNQKNARLEADIVRYVEENYTSSSISQMELADRFEVARSTVSKLFKEATGMNFIDYLHRMRVNRAMELFDNGENDVMKVARICGYENEVTFKRAFQKHQGMTPREYVKRSRR